MHQMCTETKRKRESAFFFTAVSQADSPPPCLPGEGARSGGQRRRGWTCEVQGKSSWSLTLTGLREHCMRMKRRGKQREKKGKGSSGGNTHKGGKRQGKGKSEKLKEGNTS